jgi:hypothetical protein
MARVEYRAQMSKWAASVPAAAPPQREDKAAPGMLPFSRELLPLVDHPLLRQVGHQGSLWLLAQRLYSYMDWTFALETNVVLPVAGKLLQHGYGLDGGPELREDALKIIVDEGHHALEAMSTKNAVVAATGVVPVQAYTPPSFVARLARVEGESPASERAVVRLVFAMVSETLITSLLTKLPKDETVLPVVRAAIRQHAHDEARHHSVFAKVMEVAWSRWSVAEQDRYAPLFADFLEAFLLPNVAAADSWLRCLGIADDVRGAVLEDVYAPSRLRSSIREASEPSLRAMRRAGIFDNRRFVDVIGAKGMN